MISDILPQFHSKCQLTLGISRIFTGPQDFPPHDTLKDFFLFYLTITLPLVKIGHVPVSGITGNANLPISFEPG